MPWGRDPGEPRRCQWRGSAARRRVHISGRRAAHADNLACRLLREAEFLADALDFFRLQKSLSLGHEPVHTQSEIFMSSGSKTPSSGLSPYQPGMSKVMPGLYK